MFKLKNSVYDWLKWITIVLIPVLGEAYVRLADVWNLPYAQQVNETALVITFVLGAILGISTFKYNKDKANIKGDDE